MFRLTAKYHIQLTHVISHDCNSQDLIKPSVNWPRLKYAASDCNYLPHDRPPSGSSTDVHHSRQQSNDIPCASIDIGRMPVQAVCCTVNQSVSLLQDHSCTQCREGKMERHMTLLAPAPGPFGALQGPSGVLNFHVCCSDGNVPASVTKKVPPIYNAVAQTASKPFLD